MAVELEVEIEKGVYRGLGLARPEGRVIFVPRAFPGDRLRVRLEREGGRHAEARVLEVLRAGPGRRAAPCPHAAVCGGCAYQELGDAEQLELKRAIVRESLQRAGLAVGDLPIRGGPPGGWRLRASLHLDDDRQPGFREWQGHRVVPVTACGHLSAPLNAAVAALGASLRARPALLPAGADLEVIESQDLGLRLLALPAAPTDVLASGLLDELRSQGRFDGLGCWAGTGAGRRFVPLWGARQAEARVLGQRLAWSPGSFFQANRFLLEALVEAVLGRLPDAGPVLDLYAGVGLFAAALRARGHEVEAVELSRSALEDARANLGPEARLHEAEALAFLRRSRARAGESVVVDPPRTGLGPSVVQALVRRAPARLVYVSCDPVTLARDLAQLREGGYELLDLEAFDQFPGTFHVECVARLGRAA